MAAWTCSGTWSSANYQAYRKYVETQAPGLKGQTDDCADLSLQLLVDFAAANGLCLTLTDGDGVRYIAKASAQLPAAGYFGTNLTWTNKSEYYDAVKRRIGAKSLFNANTVANSSGPLPGDLMISTGHAALIFAFYPPAVLHPKAGDTTIPDFPGPDVAKTQIDQVEYIKSRTLNGHSHIDYLNHRGAGGKVKAELIYFADVDAMKANGFEYRKYSDAVIDNWGGWNGSGDPPH